MLLYAKCEKCGTEFVKGMKKIMLCRECAHERHKEKMREYMRNKFNTDEKYKEEKRTKSREYQRRIREAPKVEINRPTCPDCGREVLRKGDRCHECSLKHKSEKNEAWNRKNNALKKEERSRAREESIAKKAAELMKKKAELAKKRKRVCRTAVSIGGSINKDRDLGARAKAAAEERSLKARLALLKKVHAKYHERKEMQKERVMRMNMEQERIADGWW